MAGLIWTIDAIARETMLFAAIGFLIGGIDDLIVDLLWLWHRARDRWRPPPLIGDLPPAQPVSIAIFVAAWHEAAVIGAMLDNALARIIYPDYRIYVGTYPNDRPTIDAVALVAERDDRVRLIIGRHAGPTTKADNLNAMWRAMLRADAARGEATQAILLHDAEDVVDPHELIVHATKLVDHGVVQTPVVPLIDPAARLVSGHYADEFAESHGRQLPVRAALGAGLPLAGVGCAIRVDALHAIAAEHGQPFDASSLTEDYELGLRLGAMGLPTCFARVRAPDGRLIATRGYFPSTVRAAVAQKARWMTGIALAGWDRIGWGRWFDLRDHWMRMRDRRGPLAVLVLAIAYVALIAWAVSEVIHGFIQTPRPAFSDTVDALLLVNAALLAWRMAMRIGTTGALYGWREGLWSIPRLIVANTIALLAARRAMGRYIGMIRGDTPRWDKTDHVFPGGLGDLPSP